MCFYIVQQFLLRKDPSSPSSPSESVLQHMVRFNREKPCLACLGVLQVLDDGDFMQHMFDTIQNSGYDTDMYYLALTTPVSVLMRHFQLWYHLQDLFSDLPFLQTSPNTPDVADVKEVFKWVVGHVLFMKIRMKFQFEGRFQVRLNIHHAETQLECLKLAPEIDEAQFLRDLEAERRTFLRQPAPETSTTAFPHLHEVEKAADGQSTNEDYQYSNQGPPRKRRKGVAVDGVTAVTAKLRTLSKAEFISLLAPNAPRNPITNKQSIDPPTSIEKRAEFEFSFHHLSVYAAGRYCKYSRTVSQSPWIIDGIRKAGKSVQEFIGDVLVKYFKADGYNFLSAGREDVDVRMLGRGRPFALEMINPRKPKLDVATYTLMQHEINASASGLVHVVDLQEVSEKQVSVMKDGEDTKRKSYRAVVWAAAPLTRETIEGLSTTSEFIIDQLTPVRVLHRRSLMNRKKTIHSLRGEFINDHYAILDLTTQAGTYIKEFVHSDLGRTKPSFCEFIKQDQADILLLDVTEVDLDFPPRLQNEQEPPQAENIVKGLDITLAVPEKPTGSEVSLME